MNGQIEIDWARYLGVTSIQGGICSNEEGEVLTLPGVDLRVMLGFVSRRRRYHSLKKSIVVSYESNSEILYLSLARSSYTGKTLCVQLDHVLLSPPFWQLR